MWSTCKVPREQGSGRKKLPPTRTAREAGRIYFFILLILAAGGILATRLFFLQVASHDKWIALAEGQHLAFQELSADRGEIYMHDGASLYPLAVNREYDLLYVVPKVLREASQKDRAAFVLSEILGIDASEIRSKLDRPDDPFEIVKKRLTPEEIIRVKEADLPGVALLPEKYRYYPAGMLASQVVGFSPGGERRGYGIEASYDESLRGLSGEMTQEKDAAGRWIPLSDRSVISARNGDKIILTLDRVIQYETEKILRETAERHQADRVTAIVMDPRSGAILAMASQPQFDPNAYGAVEDYAVFMNPAVSHTYEPGSVMKPFTMAIGLDAGKIEPDSVYTDTGSVTEAGYTIRNAENKVYGRSSMTKVLEESINTGVIHVEKLVGNKIFGEYLRRFGFGAKTGISLPAELPGNIKNLENVHSDIQYFTAAFGQGVSVTPMQLINAFAVLANGGTLLKPHIIDRIVHTDGTEEQYSRQEVRQVVSKSTSEKVGRMLRSVVVNGHGKQADVPGYLVVGKTGTAEVAKSDSLGYESGLTIGSFVGYAPLDDPRFVVLVKVDNPKGVQWAESTAAPAFSHIMNFLLEYEKIEPVTPAQEKAILENLR